MAGTGIEVWEIVAAFQSVAGDWTRLRKAYHWLTEAQLRAALGYYATYPREIDRIIEANASWTPQRLRSLHPALSSDPV